MKEKNKLIEMYRAYLDELDHYADEPSTMTAEEFLKMYKPRYYEKKLIFNGGSLAGFLIIGQKPDCHPDCDYFICQAYIAPEFRGKGLMFNALREFIDRHKGRYCLDVLYHNHRARDYWFRSFRELGYIDITLPFIEHGVTGICETLFFEERRAA